MTKIDIILLGLTLPSLGFTIGWIARGLKCDYFSVYMVGFMHGLNRDFKMVKTFPGWMIDEFFGRKPAKPTDATKQGDKPVGSGTDDSGTGSS